MRQTEAAIVNGTSDCGPYAHSFNADSRKKPVKAMSTEMKQDGAWFDREALYELIWAEPASKLAPQF